MIQFKRRVGRLLTIRFLPPVTDEEFARFEAEIAEIARSAASQMIFCTDLRGGSVLTDKVADRIVASMRHVGPRVKRAALLLPSDSAVLSMQFERIVREAGNPARRTFRRVDEALAWLGEALLPDEREGLAAFIAEWTPRGSQPPPSGRRSSVPPAPAGSRSSSLPPMPAGSRPGTTRPPSGGGTHGKG